MKITERRIVEQQWYETDLSKTGWECSGWRFKDYDEEFNGFEWDSFEVIRTDNNYNPTMAVVEKRN